MTSNAKTITHLQAEISRIETDMEVLKQARADQDLLLENSPDIIYRVDLNGYVTYISPAVEDLSGYTVEEAVGMHMAKDVYLYPETRESFLKEIQKTGEIKNFIAPLKRKDGSIWWAAANSHLYKNEDGRVAGVEGVVRDVTEQIKITQALRESEERFRNVIESSPMGVHLYQLEVDDRLILTGTNKASDIILKIDTAALMGSAIEEAFPMLTQTDIPEIYRSVCKTGRVWMQEQVNYEDDQISGAYEVHAFQTAQDQMAVFFLDISERKIAEEKRKALEEQLIQAQKMKAIDTLAGGIAHDFNNILMGIQGRISLALKDAPANSSQRDHLINSEKYIHSAVNLTEQLLGFARGGKYDPKPLELNRLVENSLSLFGRTRKALSISLQSSALPLTVEGDEQQLHQVLLNIYLNAWHAMAEGGDLTVQTAQKTLSPDTVEPFDLNAGPYAMISIADTGVGMDKQTLNKIFEPFFTTRSKSRGTGLGLASAYGIIKKHQGLILAHSEPDNGSVFEVYLPLSDRMEQTADDPKESVIKGKETILLIDDEDWVLDVTTELLKELGYQVHGFRSGRNALEFYQRHTDQIDLVILDMVMPQMDGYAVYHALRQINADVVVLLASGYSFEGKAKKLLSQGCNGFIQKPFKLELLSQKVRDVLAQSG